MPRGKYKRRKKKSVVKQDDVLVIEMVSKPIVVKDEFPVVPVAPIVQVIPVIHPHDAPPDDLKNIGHWGNVPALVLVGPDWIWRCRHWKCNNQENQCPVTEYVDWFHTNKRVLKVVTCQKCGRRYIFPGQVFDRLLNMLIEENSENE